MVEKSGRTGHGQELKSTISGRFLPHLVLAALCPIGTAADPGSSSNVFSFTKKKTGYGPCGLPSSCNVGPDGTGQI